jgi:hypothetical protein
MKSNGRWSHCPPAHDGSVLKPTAGHVWSRIDPGTDRPVKRHTCDQDAAHTGTGTSSVDREKQTAAQQGQCNHPALDERRQKIVTYQHQAIPRQHLAGLLQSRCLGRLHHYRFRYHRHLVAGIENSGETHRVEGMGHCTAYATAAARWEAGSVRTERRRERVAAAGVGLVGERRGSGSGYEVVRTVASRRRAVVEAFGPSSGCKRRRCRENGVSYDAWWITRDDTCRSRIPCCRRAQGAEDEGPRKRGDARGRPGPGGSGEDEEEDWAWRWRRGGGEENKSAKLKAAVEQSKQGLLLTIWQLRPGVGKSPEGGGLSARTGGWLHLPSS